MAAGSLLAWNPDEQPNVNSRYTVESVHISSKRTSRLTPATRQEMESVVGQKLDHSLLDELATRIKKELRVDRVAIHIARGTLPEQVTVEFTIEGERRKDFDLDIPKGVYHSKQGWSGGVETTTSVAGNDIGLGVISDGDSQVERFSGIRARFERNSLGTDRLRLRFDVESYHEQWNDSTYSALGSSHFSPDLYRSRRNYQPSITFVIAEPLTLTVGVSVEHLDLQLSTAGTGAANAAFSTLRYHRRWQAGAATNEFDAGYGLRSGTGVLGSDYFYTRHAWNVNYRMERGHHTMAVDFTAGRITGNAPLFERFVLGNGGTLRGWNKFDLDPLGGDRMVHGSAGYSYHGFQAFYDTGAIWDRKTDASAKQSAGVGFGRAGKDGFLIAIAFPLHAGHIEPMLIAGFNF